MWKRLLIWVTAVLVVAIVATILVQLACNQSYPSAWVARYDGTAGSRDEARVICLDGDGNVLVAGFSAGTTSNDFLTAKYDREGNQLWVARYDGPAGGNDKVYGIAVDASNNVYVTGESEGNGTSYDYATVKYSPNGDELWVARYDGRSSGSDGASGVQVDAEGNVYVTGYSAGSGADYVTIKYDSGGNELWTARYDGPRKTGDYPTGLALDRWGNVHVTGYSSGNGTSTDYATVKYDSDGRQVWVARYDGPVSAGDEARAIAVDAEGYVYVTGFTTTSGYGSGADSDMATIKYDAEGNHLWAALYNVEEGGRAIANALTLDASGNVYVAGSVTFTVRDYTSSDAITLKYDTDGNLIWAARYDSFDRMEDGANDIAVDGAGNVYITGSSAGIGSYNDYITIKYDREGNQVWFARYDGPRSGADIAFGIVVDESGYVFVTGFSYSEDAFSDFATIMYPP